MTFFADIMGQQQQQAPIVEPKQAAAPKVDIAELARQRAAKLARQKNRDSLIVEAGGTGTGLSIPQ
jgi:hypothetical protein